MRAFLLAIVLSLMPSQAFGSDGVTMYQLGNGLRVVLYPRTDFPDATIVVRYRGGWMSDPPGRRGLSHVLEHMVLSTPLPQPLASQWAQAAVRVRRNGSTHRDSTHFYMTVPRGLLQPALWIHHWRMGGLVYELNDEMLDHEVDVVTQEMSERGASRPYATMMEVEDDGVQEPGRARESDGLRAITLDEVRRHYWRWYAPANAVLAIVGDFDPGEVRQWIADTFGALTRRPAAALPTSVVKDQDRRVSRYAEPVGRAPRLLMSWPTPPLLSREDAAADITAAILSDLGTSRAAVLESVASLLDAGQGSFESGGIFRIRVEARPGTSIDELKDKVDGLLAELRAQPPSTKELERARRRLATRQARRIDDPVKLATQLSVLCPRLGTGLPQRLLQDFYATVRPEDVQSFVRTFLTDDRRVLVYAEPVRPSTRAAAPGGANPSPAEVGP